MKVLVTGAAGFIGFHVAARLVERGDDVTGFDNVNTYYEPSLKEARLAELEKRASTAQGNWRFVRADLTDQSAVDNVFGETSFDRVIHLAAQPGVRHSLQAPREYVDANITGTLAVLEACRHASTPHLTFASTSSVYGANRNLPYREAGGADHPLQFYAATKRANELMAHAYSHLFKLPVTGLRFFTVYGPWGRPDMAPQLFTKAILAGDEIAVFNNGHHSRDFTYIDDIAEGVIRASDQIASPDPDWDAESPNPATSSAPYRIFNIGNAEPVELNAFIEAIEQATGKTAHRKMQPMQPGDVKDTLADSSALAAATGYRPSTSVTDGVAKLVAWYRAYYGV